MFRIKRPALAIAALTVFAPLALMGCSATGTPEAPSSSSSAPASSAPASSAPATSAAPAGDEPFGAGCSAVPTSGKGSFDGMSQDPVATAASNNPELSTLVTAVGEAGLVDTLNEQEAITVFAPANSAFAKLPEKDLKAVLADKKLLTSILTYHVVGERLAPDALAGEHKTLAGGTVSVEGEGESFTVNGNAAVACGNVQTANATVYIIDTVLMPPS